MGVAMSVTVAMPREYRSWWEWRYEMCRQAGLIETGESIEYPAKDWGLWWGGLQKVDGQRAKSLLRSTTPTTAWRGAR